MASNAETGETRIPSIPDTYSDHEPSENWARELAVSLQPPPFATDAFCFSQSDRRPDQLDVGTKVRVTSEALSVVRPAAS